ncbi:MAG: GAF domain-containing protein [Methanobacterium sp.]|uniref:histidine kinase dimerization/phosphoacceptor domain -containing protein n=1 Tax=Methanobacterium sp. TaxID=2164 RepID=UPI003D64B266|nr:GAF domain-containing protein [Methanobacterium sp.]
MPLVLDPIYLANLILSLIIVVIGFATYKINKNLIALYIALAFLLFGISHFFFLVGLKGPLEQYLVIIRIIAYILIIYGLYRSWGQVKTQITKLSNKNKQLKIEIIERERAEEKILHLNSILISISNINQLIVKEKDPETLLKKVCEILFKTRDFHYVWIGKVEKNSFKLKPVASEGISEDNLKFFNVTGNNPVTGETPIEMAIKTGKTQVNPSTADNAHQESNDKGDINDCNTSYIALPIFSGVKIYGVLNICSEHKEPFDSNEVTLLGKLVEDIGFALHNIKIEAQHKIAEEKIKKSLEEKEVLLKEIHHRVKNNMQIVSSLLRLQSRYIDDKKTFELFRDSQNRVKTMSLVHEKLYQSEDLSVIDFEEYIKSLINDLFRSYGITRGIILPQVSADNISFDVSTAIPCGLIINEIVTNSIKHAFPNGKKGTITVDLHSNGDDSYVLTVSDDGIGFPEDIDYKNTKSLGLHLVMALTDQIHGNIEMVKNKGTKFKITFNTGNKVK